jgi:hypothetical protein
MEKAEARRKLKGLQSIVHARGDSDVLAVFDEIEEYIAKERPEKPKRSRRERSSYDRSESGGHDRGGE